MYIEKEIAYARRQWGSPGLTKLKSCFFIMLYIMLQIIIYLVCIVQVKDFNFDIQNCFLYIPSLYENFKFQKFHKYESRIKYLNVAVFRTDIWIDFHDYCNSQKSFLQSSYWLCTTLWVKKKVYIYIHTHNVYISL